MGIQSWALRAQPLTSVVAEVVEKVVEEVIEKPVDDVKENVAPVEVLVETVEGVADVVERDVTPEISNIDVSQLDWSALQSMVSSCAACGLHESRTNTVFGVGNHQVQVMVIGEAPGADEDQQGEPFVTASCLITCYWRSVLSASKFTSSIFLNVDRRVTVILSLKKSRSANRICSDKSRW